MRAMLLLIVVGALVVTILGGCGGQSSQSQKPVETMQVEMPPSYRFEPAVIQVKAGATVTWTNRDNFTHNVHLLGSTDWHSDPLRPGQSTSHTFAQPGEYPYQCDFHSQNMKGKVIVVP